MDKTSFKVLLDDIYKKSGVREDVLEKDYYVTRIFSETITKKPQKN